MPLVTAILDISAPPIGPQRFSQIGAWAQLKMYRSFAHLSVRFELEAVSFEYRVVLWKRAAMKCSMQHRMHTGSEMQVAHFGLTAGCRSLARFVKAEAGVGMCLAFHRLPVLGITWKKLNIR